MGIVDEVVIYSDSGKLRKPYRKSRDLTYRLDFFADERKLFLSPCRANGDNPSKSYHGLACDNGILYIQVESNHRLDERVETLAVELEELSVGDKLRFIHKWKEVVLLTEASSNNMSCTKLASVRLNVKRKYRRLLELSEWTELQKRKIDAWARDSHVRKGFGYFTIAVTSILKQFGIGILTSLIAGLVILVYGERILVWINRILGSFRALPH